MATFRAAAAAAVLLGALAGCSSSPPTRSPSAPGPATTAATPTTPSASSAVSPEPTRAPSGQRESARAPSSPSPGDVNQTVPTRPISSRPPVALEESSKPLSGVLVTLPSIKAIQAKGRGPGEVSGPALAVTVRVRNDRSTAVDLGNAVVNLTAADGSPGSMMTGPPADPLPARVGSGKAATGVYVFAVPVDQRDPIVVEASIGADIPTAVFRGKP